MEFIINIISWIFILIGCLFVFGGALGLIRMPDLYTRVHAASVTDTGGLLFIMIGLVLQAIFIFENPMAAIKLILVTVFVFFTAPTASHAVTKAALMSRLIPRCRNGSSVVDESIGHVYSDEVYSDKVKSDKTSNAGTVDQSEKRDDQS
jgi:multicomponent Na+:H+ antiporter subunit G